jgi:hypothetical protein
MLLIALGISLNENEESGAFESTAGPAVVEDVATGAPGGEF